MNAEILKNKLIDSSLLEAEAALELLRNGAELVVDDTIIDVASSGILDTGLTPIHMTHPSLHRTPLSGPCLFQH